MKFFVPIGFWEKIAEHDKIALWLQIDVKRQDEKSWGWARLGASFFRGDGMRRQCGGPQKSMWKRDCCGAVLKKSFFSVQRWNFRRKPLKINWLNIFAELHFNINVICFRALEIYIGFWMGNKIWCPVEIFRWQFSMRLCLVKLGCGYTSRNGRMCHFVAQED